MTMLLSLLFLMFSATAMAFLLLLVFLLLLASGIHLVASFLALTAIPAVADDQCHAVAGFPVIAEVPYLAEFAAVAGVPTIAG
jgi:hypothetical protein